MSTYMNPRYCKPAVLLHWLMASLILTALPLGFYMHDLPLSPQKLQLYAWHKWLGVTVLILLVPRLVWRWLNPPPPALPGPCWQLLAASAVHLLLYGLMLAIPLSGWLMSSAKGFPVVYLGVLPLPDLVSKDEALAELFKQLHLLLNLALLGPLALHLGAVLKHQLIDRDGTLRRMLP